MGQVPEVSLRGTAPKHTLFLKDGTRLNNQNDLSPIFTGFLDTSDLERVEILKGSASVQHGSDAIGGVVQMISKTPNKTGGFITGVYGENNTRKVIIGGDLTTDNGFYAQVRGQRLDTDGTRIFDSQPKHQKAGFNQQGYNAKAGFDNKDNIDVSVGISQNKGTNMFSNDGGISNISPRAFDNRTIVAKATIKPLTDLTVGLRYGNTHDKQNVPAYFSHYNTQAQEADIYGKWQFANQNVLFGATHNQSTYQSNTITNGQQAIKTTGYYAQHQYNSDTFNTQAGIRLEDNQRFGKHTVGQLAGRYHLSPSTSIYANLGSAFRAPSLNELYSQWGGNADLKPEKSTSYELGLDHRLNDNLSTHLSVYQTKIDDLIVYQNNKNQNIQQAQFTGGEIGVKYAQGDYYAQADYAHTDTKNKTTGLPIAYRPKHTGTLTLGYDDGVYGVSMSALARSKANASNSANSVTVAGHATMDLHAHWHATPNVKVFGTIQNFWNTQYKTVHNTIFDPVTFMPTGENWYINGGRQANIGVTLSY